MNGATIGAIAAALIAMASAALTLWIGRTDRASKLTREGMDNLLRDSRTMTAMRNDVWHWEQWGRDVSLLWHEQQQQLLQAHIVDRITDLPPFPESELHQLERELGKDHH